MKMVLKPPTNHAYDSKSSKKRKYELLYFVLEISFVLMKVNYDLQKKMKWTDL